MIKLSLVALGKTGNNTVRGKSKDSPVPHCQIANVEKKKQFCKCLKNTLLLSNVTNRIPNGPIKSMLKWSMKPSYNGAHSNSSYHNYL